ncbi:MAG: hypothetical protein IKD47_03035 [Clostridia bacterium]|nr:hypothetical protein [Clostridia bacterium]
MSKLTNTVKKGTIWSVILGVILVAAIVVGAMFGVNKATAVKDAETLTVTVNRFAYATQEETILSECEDAFADAGVEYISCQAAKMSGDFYEVVYTFEADVELNAVKEALQATFDGRVAAEGDVLQDADVIVSSGSEDVLVAIAEGYVLRGVIACVVLAVLAFAYVAIRYNLGVGITTGIATLVGMGLTAGIAVLARIPVTASLLYVVGISGLMTAVCVLLTMNKIRSSEATDEAAEETIAANIATKEIALLAICGAVVCVALGVVGAIVNPAILWFAVATLVAVAVSAFVGIVYAPALYLPFKKAWDKKAAARSTSYKGAKRTSTKIKKIFEKKAPKTEEPVAEEVAEEPVAEEVAEETAEEAVEETKEIVEEAAEEPVEEAAVEETPVEEVAEETVTTEEAVEETAEAAEETSEEKTED